MATPNPVRKWTLVVLAICFVIFGYSLIADRLVPYTSQAVVQAYIVGIAPEVAGRIIAVNVEDNQQVKAGQILTADIHRYPRLLGQRRVPRE